LATGRVLQFDPIRGYGFVAADDGGEDIFLHSSVFDGDPDQLAPGMMVEFNVMAGDRGRKAFAAHLFDDPEPTPRAMPVPAPPLQAVTPATLQGPTVPVTLEPDEEPMCDVLPPAEFRQELTELLIAAVPELTGQQILQLRQSMLEFAKKHGWSDG
jgi:cold shock protein